MNYIVSSPALSVEDSQIYRKASDLVYYSEDYDISYEKVYYDRSELLNKNVYLTCEGDMNIYHKKHVDAFNKRAEKYQIAGYEYEYFPEFDHFGMFKEALKNTVIKFYSK